MNEGSIQPLQKTTEQLQRDFRWVNQQKIMDHVAPLLVPSVTFENPRELTQRIKKLSQEPLAPEENSILVDYNQYLHWLRHLRRSEKWLERNITVKSPPTIRSGRLPLDQHVDSIGFARHVAHELLIKINFESDANANDLVFTKKDIDRAMRSENDFFAVLQAGLDRRPSAIYKVLDNLLLLLSPERLKELVVSAGFQPVGYVYYFNKISPLFSPIEQRSCLDLNLANTKCNHFQVLTLFHNPQAVALYTIEELHDIIVNALKKSTVVYSSDAKFYLNNATITPEDLKGIILYQIQNLAFLSQLPEILQLLKDQPDLLNEVKTTIFSTYTTTAMGQQIENLYIVRDMFSPAELLEMISSIVNRDQSSETFHAISTIEKLISISEFAPLLIMAISVSNLELDGVAVESILKAKCLNDADKEHFVENLVASNRAGSILDREGNGLAGFSDEAIKQRVAKNVLLHCESRQVANTYRTNWSRGWGDQVDKQTVMTVVDNSPYGDAGAWIYQMTNLNAQLTADFPNYVPEFLERHIRSNTVELLRHHSSITKCLPAERRAAFTLELIKANPIEALVLSVQTVLYGERQSEFVATDGTPITPEQIMQYAKDDTGRISFAPKSFRDFFRQFQLSISVEKQKSLLIEAERLYIAIGFIQALGIEESYRHVFSQRDLSAGEEKELLSIFYCLAMLKDRRSIAFSEFDNLGESLEEAKEILFSKIAQLLGLDQQTSQDEISKFIEMMESPVPFMLYLLQFEKSPAHKMMLRDIFISIAKNSFCDWKYGAGTTDVLEEMKSAQLLPQALTFDQFLKWRTDEQTTLFDTLSSDTEATANAIRNYLKANIEYLHIEDTMEHLLRKYSDKDPLDVIQLEIGSIGQELAETNKELSDLRKLGQPDIQRRITLEETRGRLEFTKNELLKVKKILRLIIINQNEVASGFFIEVKGGGRGQSIDKVIAELKNGSAEADQFVYDEVQKILLTFRSTSDEIQNLCCVDSSDPKVWIEIGETPVSSCQSYNHGEYNECLLGYTDPNSKILVLKNEVGSIVGRAIFRLLTTSTGKPALHIERIYSSFASKGVLRSIFARAHQKALDMGVPLLISEKSLNGHEEVQTEIGEGYKAIVIDYHLVSNASRAPKVYVDSANGVTSGRYEIRNLLEIQKA